MNNLIFVLNRKRESNIENIISQILFCIKYTFFLNKKQNKKKRLNR